jgi:hypothetical protein
MIGRASKLERLGLAEQVAPGCWTLKPDIVIRGRVVDYDNTPRIHRSPLVQ